MVQRSRLFIIRVILFILSLDSGFLHSAGLRRGLGRSQNRAGLLGQLVELVVWEEAVVEFAGVEEIELINAEVAGRLVVVTVVLITLGLEKPGL